MEQKEPIEVFFLDFIDKNISIKDLIEDFYENWKETWEITKYNMNLKMISLIKSHRYD